MKHPRITYFALCRLLALTIFCAATAVHADDYGDVNQLLHAGKTSDALIKADKYLAVKPGDPQMRFLKGVIQRSLGKSSEAITTFTQLTEDYPELPEPYNNLAVLYAGQNQFDKARSALEQAIRTNPSYATAHENLGDVYARLASQAYNKALQLDAANAAVPPKLALIKELFKPNIKSQTGTTPTPLATVATTTAPTAGTTPLPVAKNAATNINPGMPGVVPKQSVTDSVSALSAPQELKAVEAAIRAWAKAWSAKDMTAYLGAYGKEFIPPAKQSRNAWEEERRKRIAGKSNISVKLENLHVTVNANKAVAKFRQDYRADALAVSSRKTLDMVKVGDKWVIVRESTGN